MVPSQSVKMTFGGVVKGIERRTTTRKSNVRAHAFMCESLSRDEFETGVRTVQYLVMSRGVRVKTNLL